MASIVSICNLALSNIGKDTISSLDDASAEARYCTRFYGQARDALLSSYPWRFAIGRQVLSEQANDRAGAWLHAFAMPADVLSVRYIEPVASTTSDFIPYIDDGISNPSYKYDYSGGVLYSNLSPLVLVYVKRVEDSGKFPPLFVDALAWHLSMRLAMPLTRDINLQRNASGAAQQAAAVAKAADANDARTTSRTGSTYEDAHDELNGVFE
ncbi:hypothetical protein [Pleomorphomonas oryzae]|uniref:hypothetical protein n=1 Tax=Pleomorphomonas oryzae TaxID=261934 RepID=UPI000687FD69|nr:hypothetical protein [Pleomorphomonas oryzae]